MACDTFGNCVGVAPFDAPAFADSTSSTVVFFINAALYLMNAGIILWMIYSLVKGIYLLVKEDNQENFAVARKTLTHAVVAGFGLVILQNANFLGAILFKLIGVSDGANLFLHTNLVGLN